MHNLGIFLSRKQVTELAEKIVQGRRVSYLKVTAKEKIVWDGIKGTSTTGAKQEEKQEDA